MEDESNATGSGLPSEERRREWYERCGKWNALSREQEEALSPEERAEFEDWQELMMSFTPSSTGYLARPRATEECARETGSTRERNRPWRRFGRWLSGRPS